MANMSEVNCSDRTIPFDVIIIILKYALATSGTVLPSAFDRQLRASTLRLNHDIRKALIKDIYNTVVLWSADSLRKFPNALDSSPYLGSLVLNLWAGSFDAHRYIQNSSNNLFEGDCEDIPNCLGRVLTSMPNLQRLYITFIGDRRVRPYSIPQSVRHLTIPNSWMAGIMYLNSDVPFEFPPALESLRIRGHLGLEQAGSALDIESVSSRLFRVVMEMPYPKYCEVAWLATRGALLPPVSNRRLDVVVPPSVPNGFASDLNKSLASCKVRVITQPLNDLKQLEIWLSEGEFSQFGAF
ncbi:hypothetical protein FRC07_014277 [Ceratobasidium sp. 392]|nr:hypothetical protein FRC07_014277 [Ceratobasidium sp. 392]